MPAGYWGAGTAVGGTGVGGTAVGGTGVAVGAGRVAVGGTAVDVAGTGVAVGATVFAGAACVCAEGEACAPGFVAAAAAAPAFDVGVDVGFAVDVDPTRPADDPDLVPPLQAATRTMNTRRVTRGASRFIGPESTLPCQPGAIGITLPNPSLARSSLDAPAAAANQPGTCHPRNPEGPR